ncbi:MAG: alpha-amylase family glycosyl hydrolase, partial [Anaerolineales bacterium]|nr:alpha-amylase family glycosyl hydrolase [Anaerolineales bacterium]
LARLRERMEAYRGRIPTPSTTTLTERDALLITYGDQVTAPGEAPLRTLADFCARHLADVVSGVHILPFYPWTSDDGFSVVDYRAVDPALGTWDDVACLRGFRLMFDAVINHASSQSEWFRGFLADDPRYRDFFVTVEGDPDLSLVVRPRALPLLTRFRTAAGERAVWTTFSDDQVDLNYANPEVLLEILDLLLFYAERGAEFIRLDAIAYLWKEIGTPCIHLPQTHRVIQLFRAVLDDVAPHVRLITETNVPHRDNISYFGDGTNEAQLVYNFALPPLTLYALHTGEARILSEWAAGLSLPSDRVTFFNFLASHDGIGLNPARGILSEAEIEALVARARAHGGLVSYKHNPDGTQSPYELNINYFDALSDPNGAEPPAVQIDRFLCAQAILLAIVGVPGIYFHSLFGSRGWPEGVRRTGRNRTINRQKFERAALERELADPTSLRYHVFTRYRELLRVRAASPAFHPHGRQEVFDYGPAIFAVRRTSPDGAQRVLCLHNVSAQPQPVRLSREATAPGQLRDLVTGQHVAPAALTLAPYQVKWLEV